jgi:outer membrane protein TolC
VREALEARAQASSDVRDQEVYVEAARMDVTQAEDELASARDELAALNARRPDVVRKLNEPFRCPNGNPWSECTHYDLKDQYIKQQNDLSDQLRQIDRRMSDLRSSIPVYEGDLERAERNLETARNHLRDLRQVLRTAEANHAEAVRVYNEREQFTREEKWRSWEVVFLPENASDEGRVKAIIQQAGA